MARHHERPAGASPAADGCDRRGPERRLRTRPAARYGGIEPRSRSDEDDVRQDRRLPRAARSRFDGPGASQSIREHSRSARTRSSSSRANQARRSSRTSSSSTSSTASSDWWARRKPAAGSSPSPIPARRCNRSPSATVFGTSFSAGRTSAAATRCSLISAWCPRPSWAWTWRSSWTGPRRWSVPACRRFPLRKTLVSSSARSSASPRTSSAATK